MAVPRESQIDAVELDSECGKLFESQFSQALSHLPLNILKKIEPEIHALLNLAVYVVPLYTSSSLVSHQLLGIKFTDNAQGHQIPIKWYSYGCLLVGIHWLSQRWNTISSRLLNENTLQPASRVLNYLEISIKIGSLINSLVFLKQGLFPTLLHRILNLRTTLVDPNQPRSTDLSTLTRELLWHSFAETLIFALPLINIHRVKRWLNRLSKFNAEDDEPIQNLGVFEKNSLCPVCQEAPTLPQESSCRHVFCYYCLKANLAACSDYTCPLCDSPVADE